MTVKVHNLETGEKMEVTEETWEENLSQKDMWIQDKGTEKTVEPSEKPEKKPKNPKKGRESRKKNNSNKGPVWSEKYWIGEHANISLNIWDRGDFYGCELVRSEKKDGKWEDTGRVFLPSSKTLLEMSMDLKEMFKVHKKLRKEGSE